MRETKIAMAQRLLEEMWDEFGSYYVNDFSATDLRALMPRYARESDQYEISEIALPTIREARRRVQRLKKILEDRP